MDFGRLWTGIYQTLTLLVSFGILGLLWRIGVQLGIWKEWVRTTDKELAAQGSLLQQATGNIARILGREEGRREKEKE